jgi:hypothetical protein
MPTLVDPEYTVHVFADRAALDAFVKQKGIAGQFASNLRQLCGFTDGRVGKGRGGWALLEKVKYLKFSGNESLIPVWGAASDIWKTVAGLRESMPEESFKKLLNGNCRKPGPWPQLHARPSLPAGAARVSHDC